MNITMEQSATGPTSMNLVASMAEEDMLNLSVDLCIICQEDTKSPVTSQKTGRARMKRAASIRNDDVAKRIKRVVTEDDDDDSMFVYHNTNICYKSYTHSGKLRYIQENSSQAEDGNNNMTSETADDAGLSKTLRRNVAPCAPPSCDKDPSTLPCVICGHVRHRTVRDKFRICEYDSCSKFIEAAKHNQDEVFTRIADRLQDDEGGSVRSVVSADLYCHNLCLQNYFRKYERDIKPEELENPDITNIKRVLFTRALPYIDRLLERGDCFTMTDLVQFQWVCWLKGSRSLVKSKTET